MAKIQATRRETRMAITRIFMDWNRPALAAAADYLVGRFAAAGELDLAPVVLALPGGRAGRRLLEILVQQADERELLFCPPRIVTTGKLPELLYEAKRPFANELVQQLAWIEALHGSDPGHVQAVVPQPPERDDFQAWLSLGEMLARLHRELAAEAMDFSAVAQCGAELEGFREAPRWQALAEIQKRYLATLDRLGLWDLQTARLVAIRNGECRTEAQIVLLGTADLNRSQRMMLDQVAEHVTALVCAPEELAERFDEHGCLCPAAWLDQAIPLADEQIEVVNDPAEQAAATVHAIAGFEGRYNTADIAVGAADEQVVPYIQQRLEQCQLAARYGVGVPITRSAPYRLLAAVADYVEAGSFAAFAALVRHPWVNDWLAGSGIAGDWLSQMDRYYAEHIPHAVDGQWQGAGPQGETLQQVYRAIDGLCRKLRGKPRPLADWAEPILELLGTLFGGAPLVADIEPDRTLLAACSEISDVLAQHSAIPAALMPSLESTAAVRLVLRQVGGATIPPPPNQGAIELLGWLELPLDDAPALVITGFNEGRVPASVNSDLFLPNQLRRALGIEDNDRRYARDAYALSLLAASREKLHVIAGRRSADADPLLPSRLLFACDDRTMARRVLRFFDKGDRPPYRPESGRKASQSPAGELQPGLKESRLEVPRPRPLSEPITSMRVTSFKDYLACRYRFYLRHVLKLASLADSVEELDGALFGALAHEVLSTLGKDPEVAAGTAEQIAQYLDQQLDAVVAAHFGKTPTSSILVQVEQLRRRLAAFAQWQAAWARDGWRIEHVEVSPAAGKAAIIVDGQPMGLRGRIDRIDVNESSGKRAIFDYKTSDRAQTPEQTHCTRSGQWIDLQLPLYRHLIADLGIDGPVDLAYIALPKDISRVGPSIAGWTADDLQAADCAAEDVVRRVRAGEFWPPVMPAPAFCEDFAAICQDGRFGPAFGGGEAEGGSP
jgi:ATP-dependent helicase/nuclease subunit B